MHCYVQCMMFLDCRSVKHTINAATEQVRKKVALNEFCSHMITVYFSRKVDSLSLVDKSAQIRVVCFLENTKEPTRAE